MRRSFDLIICFLLLPLITIICACIAILIWLTSSSPILYWGKRVGIYGNLFLMPKFRTMKLGTPQVASKLLVNPFNHFTPMGRVIRKYSLDELPQFWSIIKGDMTIIGHRPALFNQDDLIELREKYGISNNIPGLTGWAQVNYPYGASLQDTLEKLSYDLYYIRNFSLRLDASVILKTLHVMFFGKGR
jgi:O-antigen biosynthesis protein WbqP